MISDVLPSSRPRGWDHAVVAVRDLDAAARTYEALGFSLTARAAHPFGTANRLALLGRTYLELVAVERPVDIPEPSAEDFGFAAFVARYLEACEGLAMMALKVADAEAEASRYAEDGLTAFPVRRFARSARRPDGGEAQVSFALAHALDPRLPDLALFACAHETPDAVWAAGPRTHTNGARDILGAVVVDENPTDHHVFYATMLGLRDIRASSAGLRMEMKHGVLEVLTPAAFDARFGKVASPHDVSPRLQALRIGADRTQIVPAGEACGVALIFEEDAS